MRRYSWVLFFVSTACAGSSEPAPSSGAAPEAVPIEAAPEAEAATTADREPEGERPPRPPGDGPLRARELDGYASPSGELTTLPVTTERYDERSSAHGPSTATFSLRGDQLVITLIAHRSSCGGASEFREARVFTPAHGPPTILLAAEIDDSRSRCLRFTDQVLRVAAPAPGEYVVRVGRSPRYLLEIPPR